MRLKLTISSYAAHNNHSFDVMYKSLGWLERELSEMFNVKYLNKNDTRRLLLDYTKKENPLLKDFPTEGYNDVYYCFFNDQVLFLQNNTTEL
jgi:NADH:ubiquinone oxidoreductase subunit C